MEGMKENTSEKKTREDKRKCRILWKKNKNQEEKKTEERDD